MQKNKLFMLTTGLLIWMVVPLNSDTPSKTVNINCRKGDILVFTLDKTKSIGKWLIKTGSRIDLLRIIRQHGAADPNPTFGEIKVVAKALKTGNDHVICDLVNVDYDTLDKVTFSITISSDKDRKTPSGVDILSEKQYRQRYGRFGRAVAKKQETAPLPSSSESKPSSSKTSNEILKNNDQGNRSQKNNQKPSPKDIYKVKPKADDNPGSDPQTGSSKEQEQLSDLLIEKKQKGLMNELKIAEKLAKESRFNESLDIINDLLSRARSSEDSQRINEKKMEILAAKGDYQNSQQVAKELSAGSDSAKLVYRQGLNHLKLKKFSEALKNFHRLIEQYKSSEHVQNGIFYLALSYKNLNDHRNAIKYFNRYLSISKKKQFVPETYFYLAEIYEKSSKHRNFEKSALFYDKILKQFPDFSRIGETKKRLNFIKENFLY